MTQSTTAMATGQMPGVPDRQRGWETALRNGGHRVTKQRLAIMRAAATSPHAPAERLHAAAQAELPGLALPTVHLILNDLTSLGLLRRIDLPHSPARYELESGDNHHHAQCTVCGRIEDVECAVGHAPCLTPSDAHGMTIQIAEVLYRGVCQECAGRD